MHTCVCTMWMDKDHCRVLNQLDKPLSVTVILGDSNV